MTPSPEIRSAGVPPAVAGASRPRFGTVTIHDRGHIPHWEKEGATYFVTFRLSDSLPASVLSQIRAERAAIIATARQMNRELSSDERRKLQRLSTPIIERYLDNGSGACHLRVPTVAETVVGSLRCFNEKRYRLFAWCIMPNHVHIVFKIFPGHSLAEVVHSWKSYTANVANRILRRRGSFWQREYYDHLIRNQTELERAILYVSLNPEKAHLQNWKWVWSCGQDARTTAAEDGGATLAG